MIMHLRRYFCKIQNASNIYRDHLGLIAPIEDEDFITHFENANYEIAREWDFFSSYRSIILLGPARQGKTTEFQHQCQSIENGFILKMRDIASPQDIPVCIDDYEKWQNWYVGGDRGELFIDALDEGKIETKNVINWVASWIISLEISIRNRLRVHLSCRVADWDRADNDRWTQLFNKEIKIEDKSDGKDPIKLQGCIVVSLLDLGKKEIIEHCEKEGVRYEDFFDVIPNNIFSLIAKPQTLQYLVETFKDNPDKFPNDVSTLYNRIVQKRLEEHNAAYERSSTQEANFSDKLRISEQYALTIILSNRDVIEIYGPPTKFNIIEGLSDYGVAAERETFKSDLFLPFGINRFRFVDVNLATYLAAKKLNELIDEESLSLNQALKLFFPSDESEYPIPALNDLLSWLCRFSSEIRNTVCGINPGLLIHENIQILDSINKKTIFHWLLDTYGERGWFSSRGWFDIIGTLACPEIVEDVKKVIKGKEQYGLYVRLMSIKIAEKGKFIETIPVLETLVGDFSEDIDLVSWAGDALVNIEPGKKHFLRKWLKAPPSYDKEGTLLCKALETLWPDEINLVEFLEALRSQEEYYAVTKYRIWLKKLPDIFSIAERRLVINHLVKEIQARIKNKKRKVDGKNSLEKKLYPSDFLSEFILKQLVEYDPKILVPEELEFWLSVLDLARKKGILHDREAYHEIEKELRKNHSLRQQLCKIHILRVLEEKGENFDADKFIWHALKSFHPGKYDITFWIDITNAWEKEQPKLLTVAFESLMSAWVYGEYPLIDYDWIELLASRNKAVCSIWERYKYQSLEDPHVKWRLENARQRIQDRTSRLKDIEDVKSRIKEIDSGNERWIGWFTHYDYRKTDEKYDPSKSQFGKIHSEFGEDVAKAYLVGLEKIWSSVSLPELFDYYFSNSMPTTIACILQAIDAKKNIGLIRWQDISEEQCIKALYAGLSELNNLPNWYIDLADQYEKMTKSLWLCVLDVESQYEPDHPHLARAILHKREWSISQHVAREFLLNNKPTNTVAIPLIKTILGSKIDPTLSEYLYQNGTQSIKIEEIDRNMPFLAAYWKYDQDKIWEWVELNYLKPSPDRVSSFKKWICAIENIHVDMNSFVWPAWSDTNVLIKMLPDFLSIDFPEITSKVGSGPDTIRHLKNDLCNKIAESGNLIFIEYLKEMSLKEEYSNHKNLLLDLIERIRENTPGREWEPFDPGELWDYLEKGIRPARNQSELFHLACEIVADVKNKIERGEGNLKRLLWTDAKKKEDRSPKIEENFQILVYNEINKHPLSNKVIGVREIEISGSNKPDITIICTTNCNEKMKLYIELKRQHHDELFTAIENQLAQKYISDPESEYGIYIVCWYGQKYYGPSNKLIKKTFGNIPESAEELQDCLQRVCENVVGLNDDIKGIRAFVIDASH